MGYDFGKVMQSAQEVKEQQESRGSGSLDLYPGDGKTIVRVLFNPKSGTAFRSVKRHWSEASKKHIACLSMYGMECPICKAVSDYAATGADPGWKYNAQDRVMAYVTFEGADKPAEKGPKVGSNCLFIMPKSVGAELQMKISAYPDKINEFLTDPDGFRWMVNKSVAGGFTEYKVEMDPFTKAKTAKDEKEMATILEGLPDLNEAKFPSKPTDEMIRDAQAEANQLRTFFKLDVPAIGAPPTPSA
jgi:hypothetical protein